MFTTMVLATALTMSPSQIDLKNDRLTYGELGATRTDNKYLPGDVFFVAFDITGIKVNDQGQVKYSMEMEVLDAMGKATFKQNPVQREDFVPLGGDQLPARAFVAIPNNQPEGKYTCKVKVVDLNSKSEKSLVKEFSVGKPDFGIVAVYSSADIKGEVPISNIGVVGSAIQIQFGIVGFDRDKMMNPDILVDVKCVDAVTMKPTLPKPTSLELKKTEGAKDSFISLRIPIPMNRPGKFTVELTATDNVTKKQVKLSLPLVVLDPSTLK